jgi:hypothetical protein
MSVVLILIASIALLIVPFLFWLVIIVPSTIYGWWGLFFSLIFILIILIGIAGCSVP